jgi:hypothetical protein
MKNYGVNTGMENLTCGNISYSILSHFGFYLPFENCATPKRRPYNEFIIILALVNHIALYFLSYHQIIFQYRG